MVKNNKKCKFLLLNWKPTSWYLAQLTFGNCLQSFFCPRTFSNFRKKKNYLCRKFSRISDRKKCPASTQSRIFRFSFRQFSQIVFFSSQKILCDTLCFFLFRSYPKKSLCEYFGSDGCGKWLSCGFAERIRMGLKNGPTPSRPRLRPAEADPTLPLTLLFAQFLFG
jgi:hypothetical protein